MQISTVSFSLFWAGFNFHSLDILRSGGLPSEESSSVFLAMTAAVQLSGISMGYFIDRTDAKLKVLGCTYLCGAASILLLAYLSDSKGLSWTTGVLYGAMYGTAAGTIFAVRDISDATLFGRTSLGKASSSVAAN